jgi:hypothetical protein
MSVAVLRTYQTMNYFVSRLPDDGDIIRVRNSCISRDENDRNTPTNVSLEAGTMDPIGASRTKWNVSYPIL